MKPLPDEPRKLPKASPASLIHYYLVVYNVLSAVGWSYVFFKTSAHLLAFTALSRVAAPAASSTATSTLMRIWNSLPLLKSSVPISTQMHSRIPSALVPLLNRASTAYVSVGAPTALVQSFALLEVIHSLLRWVRSPVVTTVMQVASRLILVWGIAENYEAARNNPIYTSMVIAWSITEIIRYSFYAANLLQYEPRWLLWLRYNTFFILYPLGAGSEAALIYSTLPSSTPLSGGSWQQRAWMPWDYVRATLFLLWWPGLYVMYTYMIQQRGKVLGGQKNGGFKRKTM